MKALVTLIKMTDDLMINVEQISSIENTDINRCRITMMNSDCFYFDMNLSVFVDKLRQTGKLQDDMV